MKLKKIRIGLLSLCALASSSAVFALDTGIKGFTLDGRFVQSYSTLYDLDEGGSEEGPANYTGEVKFSFRPDRKFTFVGNFWIRGNWNDPDWIEPEGGLKNLFNGPQTGFSSGSFQHGTSRCDLNAREFCAPNDQVDIYDDFNDDIIRELSMKYRDPKNRFTAKIGKFQRGWGQSDGLRLLDIVNPQDLRSHFVFKNADETRIPLWMLSMDFNLKKMGLSKPFEAIGMNRPVLELNIAPEIRHSEIVVNNPTPGANTDGGLFGLPWPDLVDAGLPHQSGLGAVGFGAALSDNERDDFEWSDPEVSVRLKFETLGGTATLNGFYGYQDLPLVLLQGGTVHVGSGVNDASAAVANQDVSHQDLIGAIWAPSFDGSPTTAGTPSGYLPFLRGAAGKGPLTTSPLTALTGGACNDPVNNPGGGGLECSVTANLDLDYTFRQKVVGFSFTRDMSDFISVGPKGTGPALRAEVSHEFDKPFNSSLVQNPFNPAQLEAGSPALLVSPSAAVVERDVTSVMIGLDYPLWVPGWKSQEKSIFTSIQWFNIHTEDADNLLAQAPYAFTEVEEDQNFVTFLWDMKLDNQRLVAEGLYIHNIQGHGTAYRQRIDFNYFGGHWRPRIEVQSFSGRKEVAPVGLFDDKDYVEISLTYQF
ncbi:DUF1302 family protein [Candidatus Seongchinamella marina]|uniref:DUF1302 family protein n=1 Tax=Candidatus Seongchinamella marina TaxID=2518990 RepID=UPI00242C083B|nr:DUF1302 family protein [Candidatus Seongchinamella marina]